MDNLTHGFTGACLAKAGLDRFTSRATLTLVIASNLPDVDAIASLLGQDTMFHLRRGWTHGVVAQAILPWLLAFAVVKGHHILARQSSPSPRFWPTLALAYIGVLGHCFMDWLNTYGVRLLMPVDDLWRYGDTLFIVDPWVWLIAGAPVFLVHSTSRLSILGWSLFAGAATMLLLVVPEVPVPSRVLWLAGLTVVVSARVRGGARTSVTPLAAACSLLLAVYVTAMGWGSREAVARAMEYAGEHDISVERSAPMPLPASSFRREVVLATATTYRRVTVDLSGSTPPRETMEPVPIGEKSPPVEAALRTVPGTAHWMRFPYYRVETVPAGFKVILRDFRYSGRGPRELGRTEVLLDRDLNPL